MTPIIVDVDAKGGDVLLHIQEQNYRLFGYPLAHPAPSEREEILRTIEWAAARRSEMAVRLDTLPEPDFHCRYQRKTTLAFVAFARELLENIRVQVVTGRQMLSAEYTGDYSFRDLLLSTLIEAPERLLEKEALYLDAVVELINPADPINHVHRASRWSLRVCSALLDSDRENASKKAGAAIGQMHRALDMAEAKMGPFFRRWERLDQYYMRQKKRLEMLGRPLREDPTNLVVKAALATRAHTEAQIAVEREIANLLEGLTKKYFRLFGAEQCSRLLYDPASGLLLPDPIFFDVLRVISQFDIDFNALRRKRGLLWKQKMEKAGPAINSYLSSQDHR